MRLSLVIPTYNEKENIQKLLKRIFREFNMHSIEGEVIVVDDNSPDGTGIILEGLKKKHKNLEVVHRRGKLGLSSAVLRGWRIAKGEILGVMDADLSHPCEKLYELFKAIEHEGADLSIGSRYVRGGRIIGWNLKRKLMSKTATLLARAYTKIKDPMTGFFMVKKSCVEDANLNPRGFKILLEILIKGELSRVKEVPITFINRVEGKSKAGLKEIAYYLQNLLGYLSYKMSSGKNAEVAGEFFKFAFVGGIGTLINVGILYLFTEALGVYYMFSAVFSFIVAMTSNFILNKIWTFKEDVRTNIRRKYFQFAVVSVLALMVNLVFLYIFTEIFGVYYLISQVLAIGVALIINFAGNKFWTFAE